MLTIVLSKIFGLEGEDYNTVKARKDNSYLHLGFFSKHLSIKLWKLEENLRDLAMATISIPPFSMSALCCSIRKQNSGYLVC